eukprot:TRINITY_DN4337_c0_g1_i1.p1 TRINITY_DN4337_c0_g1~~TRINITY_DN4337_c0_g1_i1.p1  ORF type:complete len:322 (-),score=82.92 TRINITY_DN4337_c0_g1_i1:175-1098(-)
MAGWFNLDSITAQVTAAAAAAQESVSKFASDVQENVQHISENLAHIDINTLTQGVQHSVAAVGVDIKAEEDKFRAEKDATAACEIRLLPWETLDESRSILSDDLLAKVFALSLESATFTEAPPPDANYAFDLTPHIACAMRLMDLDANLAKMHARYISKVGETAFWRNYFYKINVLRLAAGVEPLTQAAGAGGPSADQKAPSRIVSQDGFETLSATEVQAAKTAVSAFPPPPQHAIASAADRQDANAQADANAQEQSQKHADADSGEEGGDELHDFDDLGDLEIDDADVEGDDDELEAQIAAEIGDL